MSKKLSERDMREEVELIRSIGVDNFLETMLECNIGLDFPTVEEKYGTKAASCTWGSLFRAALEEIRSLKNA